MCEVKDGEGRRWPAYSGQLVIFKGSSTVAVKQAIMCNTAYPGREASPVPLHTTWEVFITCPRQGHPPSSCWWDGAQSQSHPWCSSPCIRIWYSQTECDVALTLMLLHLFPNSPPDLPITDLVTLTQGKPTLESSVPGHTSLSKGNRRSAQVVGQHKSCYAWTAPADGMKEIWK
jgi:hypothetical protein